MSMRAFLIATIAVLGAVGCSSSGTQTLDQDYMKNAEAWGKTRKEVFDRSGGDYDKLSAEDKKAYLDTFNGDEAQARKYWELIKNPPGGGVSTTPRGGQ
jgi:hypothetical protein